MKGVERVRARVEFTNSGKQQQKQLFVSYSVLARRLARTNKNYLLERFL